MPKPKEPTFDWHPIDEAGTIIASQHGNLKLYVEEIGVLSPAGPAIIHFWTVTENAQVVAHGKTEEEPRARFLAAQAALNIRRAA